MNMPRLLRGAVVILALLLLCASLPGAKERRSADNKSVEVRNNAASLLYDLLREEKDVRKLLVIKRDSDELHTLIKAVAKEAGESAKALEALARRDTTLDLRTSGLPPGERAARESISKAKAGELLRAKGNDFEFRLLLTQVEALNYASHLAKVAAENDTVAERVEFLDGLSKRTARLRDEVVELLRARAAAPGSRPERK